jgi:DNA-binding CsgD family transcriptional regulator
MGTQHSGVFGRDEELSTLVSFLDEITTGPTALLLTGDAGAGKSTLWKEGVQSARDGSFRVLTCQPVESEAKLSFAALGDLFGGVAEEVERSLPAPQARALDVALLRAEPEGALPESRAVSLAVLGAIRALSEAEPLLLAMDDVQWLDPPSARVLEFALRRLVAEPVGILMALRGVSEPEVPFGLDRALPESRLRRLAIGPLALDALAHLLQDRLGAPFRRSTMVRLATMSGGNAFFALEIARASILGDEPAAGEPLPVPNSARDLTRRRMAALSDRDRRVLLVVAALSAPTLTAVDSDHDLDRPRDVLVRAVDAGLIEVEGEHLRFTHPLFGSAILSEATPEQLRALHCRVAPIATDPEERARHLALGSEGPDPLVASALDEAARRARSRGAPDAAAELSEMALRLTPPDLADERLERSLEAAKHLVAAGDAPRAHSLLEAAVDAAAPGLHRARALVALGLIQPVHASWGEAGELFLQALDEAGEDVPLRVRSELGLGYARVFTGDLAAAATHARTALELAESGTDVGDLAEALAFVVYVEFALGRGFRRDLLDRAVALEAQDEDHWTWDETRPSFTLAQLLQRTGPMDEARSVLQALLERAVAQGQEHPLPWVHFYLAELECWAGRWEIAELHARRSHELAIQTGETGHVLVFATCAVALVDALFGRADAARDGATQALAMAEKIEIVTMRITSLSVLGFLDLFQGNPAGADHHLQRAADIAASMGIEEPMLLRFVPDHVEALVALGEIERARTELDSFEERARRLDRPWALATGARCRGLLLAADGDIPGALEAFERALEFHERVPEPFELARTSFSLGRVQRRAKLRGEARVSFARALGIYAELGARPWAERAGSEARRVGVRAAGPFELTATEERVAALVVEGRTNREAADALFMSVNTIEWNLSKIHRKLGVRSRTELAAKLHEPP